MDFGEGGMMRALALLLLLSACGGDNPEPPTYPDPPGAVYWPADAEQCRAQPDLAWCKP